MPSDESSTPLPAPPVTPGEPEPITPPDTPGEPPPQELPDEPISPDVPDYPPAPETDPARAIN